MQRLIGYTKPGGEEKLDERRSSDQERSAERRAKFADVCENPVDNSNPSPDAAAALDEVKAWGRQFTALQMAWNAADPEVRQSFLDWAMQPIPQAA